MIHLQWPALLLSITGAWLVAGRSTRDRMVGFWLLLIASGFWSVWGYAAGAPAIVLAQLVFAYTSVRGVLSNWRSA
jgi:hypothetical protein